MLKCRAVAWSGPNIFLCSLLILEATIFMKTKLNENFGWLFEKGVDFVEREKTLEARYSQFKTQTQPLAYS